MGRLVLIAFVLGTAWVHLLPAVPGRWLAGGAGAAVLAACGCAARRIDARRHAWRRGLLLALGGWTMGSALALARIDLRLHDALLPAHENAPLDLTYRVAGLATATAHGQRFEADVLQAPPGVPGRVQLSWSGKAPEAKPGEVWRGTVVLRRPHGNLNPHGFDYEAYLFEHGIRATGSVRGEPSRVADEPFADALVFVQRLRHAGREAMREVLAGKRYGPVLVALALGDQAGIARQDWEVFQRSGIIHLVSISGLHVTMLAALAGWLVLRGWTLCRWRGLALPERLPAQVAAAGAALVVAWAYCLLAGWGVPARRTFFMLAVVALAALLRLPISGSRVLALAAALVCALDPWAPLAPGFWLSFGAVALLVLGGSGRWKKRGGEAAWKGRLLGALAEGARAQAVLTIGLLPALALMFQQISLVSPLANAIAIPVVSLLVTPLALAALACQALLGMAWAGGALAWLAHAVLEAMMLPVGWLADARFAAHYLAAPPWGLAALALAGVGWALQPRGLPGRGLALLLLLPMLAYRPSRPEHGDWRIAMLDVGQGSAIVIETATAAMLYDTGPPYGASADAGSRVIVPYLRARGIGALDELVVSHGDSDHAGGLASVLAAMQVTRLHASYAPDGVGPGTEVSRCAAGQWWEQDGVAFTFLHPHGAEQAPDAGRNAHSCVLRIQGRHHAALLTGDIGLAEEAALAERWRAGLAADLVTVPHHGSRHSSGRELVEATGASHAVAQAGYLNRYRHPSADAARRWQAGGSRFHRTDHHGALVFVSRDSGLHAAREREARGRYWHTAP